VANAPRRASIARSSASSALFVIFLRTTFPQVRTIAWDLDGTLGVMPGWNGIVPITNYVKGHVWLRDVLERLRDHNIHNILVSRNGSFCGRYLNNARRAFLSLGFDDVADCYRHREGSKVTGLDVAPNRVLLIDDQQSECDAALGDGGAALQVNGPLPGVFLTGRFHVMQRPHPPRRSSVKIRRRASAAHRHPF
jgi:hypothetical protein